MRRYNMDKKDLIAQFSGLPTETLNLRSEELQVQLTHMIVTDIKKVADELEVIDFVLKSRKNEDCDDGEAK